tara:strand:- start:58333 stop:59154 length:822 start_codon:yes stop_codon:yes gene_type:complete
MKKYFLLINTFIFLLLSCKNENILEIPNTENLQEVHDHLKAEQIFNHINILVENAMLDNDQHKRSCVRYSYDTSSVDLLPIIIIDFDQSTGIGCPFFENKIMTGKIIVSYSDIYAEESSVTYINFENFKVNNELVQGNVKITCMGTNDNDNTYFNIEVTNASITTSNGIINWESYRNKEWVSGRSTKFERSDDIYNITGYSYGNSVNGNNFSVTILETLNISLNCSSCTIINGKSKITRSDNISKEIDYGFDACDCDAIVKYNDVNYSIVINN